MAGSLAEVFFDTNAGTGESGYLLWFGTSRADLAQLGDDLREGARVRLVMPGELSCVARLEWDAEFECWRGVAEPGSYVDVTPDGDDK